MTEHNGDDSVVGHGGRNTASRVSVKRLFLANAVPLVGIIVFGWTPHLLLVSYWLETGVVVGKSVAKARRAEGEDDSAELPAETFNDTPTESLIGQSKREIITFFVYCYGRFWLTLAPFVIVFPLAVPSMELASPTAVGVVTISLTAHHTVSYWATYVGEREYERHGPVTVLFEPLQRVLVLHVTIVIGGFLLPTIGSGVSLLVVRVLVETYFDRWGQLKVTDPSWRRVTCPDCGNTCEQTATHCMYCSADLTEEREPVPTDVDGWGDQTDAVAPRENSPSPQETVSKTATMVAATGRAVRESIGDSSVTTPDGADPLLDPDGLVDKTLTVLVGFVGGLIVGVVGTTVLVLMTGSVWALVVGITFWLLTTAYLSRRRTVQAAVAKTGYVVAIALLVVPVIAFSPILGIESGNINLFTVLLIVIVMLAEIAVTVGWVASQFVRDDTETPSR